MNLRDLKYLLAVSEYKNFSKAAEHCATTQPTLSNQIRKLENYLEVEIFERGTHFVRVTPVGEKIIEAATQVIEHANQIVHIAREARQHASAKLTFGSFPSLGHALPLQYIFHLKQQFKPFKVQHVEEDVDVLIDLLVNQEIDFALLPLPVTHASLTGIKLLDDPLYVVVPSHHAYASCKSLQLSDLNQQPLLFLVEDQSHYRQILEHFDANFARQHLDKDDDFKAVSFEALRMMVKHGLGLAVIPGTAINHEDHDVHYIPFALPAIGRSIGVYWNRNHVNPALLQQVCAQLQRQHDGETTLIAT